jgi:hypothetical protein
VLVDAGAPLEATVDWRGKERRPLAAAAMYASLASCEILAARCPDQLDDALATAIELSSDDYPSPPNDRRAARRELVGWLIERGADPTRALLAAAAVADGSYAVLLIERGADVTVVDKAGEGVLVIAARHGHRAVVELALARGADPKARAADGATVYEVAERAYKRDRIDDARFVMTAIAAAGGGKPVTPPPPSPAGPRVGARVTHPKFGAGTITAIAGDKWTVAFDTAGKKTLRAEFLHLA